MKIKKIKILSVGKVACVLYALFGLMIGGVITLLSLMGIDVSRSQGATPNPIMGLHSIIVFPILYAIGGFLSGLLTAVFFNLATKWVGGIELETEN